MDSRTSSGTISGEKVSFAWNNKEEYDKAIADYTEAIRIDPKYAHAYYGRAAAWNAKGDKDKEMADYNEAIRLDPTLQKK
jgi:tetratricopeptide (TPR) repeat protein